MEKIPRCRCTFLDSLEGITALKIFNADQKRAYELDEKSEMDKLLNDINSKIKLNLNADTDKLSGGEKQKLILAVTLSMKQKILMLDEPLANLSKKEAIKTLELLKNLNENDYTIIIIEHRLRHVKNYVKKS